MKRDFNVYIVLTIYLFVLFDHIPEARREKKTKRYYYLFFFFLRIDETWIEEKGIEQIMTEIIMM